MGKVEKKTISTPVVISISCISFACGVGIPAIILQTTPLLIAFITALTIGIVVLVKKVE